MSTNLAIKIKKLIEENNLSIQGLEKKAGLKINSIRRIMAGTAKRPNAEALLAISRVLGCSIGELLDEEIASRSQKANFQEIIFSNTQLLEKTIMHIVEFYKKNKTHLTNRVLYEATEKIYLYLVKNNNGVFDMDFADWYLDSRF